LLLIKREKKVKAKKIIKIEHITIKKHWLKLNQCFLFIKMLKEGAFLERQMILRVQITLHSLTCF